MNTLELRNNFHNLIDSIENESLLLKFYDIIRKKNHSHKGELWNRLTKEEQIELLQAEQESKFSKNLISNKEMKKKHKKWLSK
jgi:hypothetical protein